MELDEIRIYSKTTLFSSNIIYSNDNGGYSSSAKLEEYRAAFTKSLRKYEPSRVDYFKKQKFKLKMDTLNRYHINAMLPDNGEADANPS